MTDAATTSDDILNRPVSIAAKLESDALSLEAKSRAFAGFDRLLGSLMDMPAAIFEGVSGKIRLKNEIDKELLLLQADVAKKRLSGAPAAGDGLLLNVLNNEGRRRANASAVAIEALEELKALPDHSTNTNTTSTDPLDDDWLNMFSRYAEDASSSDLQQLWGRILAREIARPGQFSRQTIRFIAELDKDTAQNCQIATNHLVANFIPITDYWNKDPGLTVALDLQRLGLLEGVGSVGMGKTFSLDDEGTRLIGKEDVALAVIGTPSFTIRLNTLFATRLGMEVFSLLKPEEPELALTQLASVMPKAGVYRIEIGGYKQLGSDLFNFQKRELLWQSDESNSS
nr:DUF2806 domain-containing protein [uncultured Sphingomonas sp.]